MLRHANKQIYYEIGFCLNKKNGAMIIKTEKLIRDVWVSAESAYSVTLNESSKLCQNVHAGDVEKASLNNVNN